MENKRNESTLNRPEGERLIDAPYMYINISEFIRKVKDEEAWQKNDRNAITVYKTSNVTMVLLCLHPRAILKDNLVDGIFTIQVLEGVIRITTPDGDVDMLADQIMVFHQRVDHSIEALMNSVLLITNHIVEN